VAEGARLESVYTATYREFESLTHRHIPFVINRLSMVGCKKCHNNVSQKTLIALAGMLGRFCIYRYALLGGRCFVLSVQEYECLYLSHSLSSNWVRALLIFLCGVTSPVSKSIMSASVKVSKS